jgi:hypothetical protein
MEVAERIRGGKAQARIKKLISTWMRSGTPEWLV